MVSRTTWWVLGLGFWVQGFRCFPWLAVNFFLKDGLQVDSSTLQLLQNSANLPMVGKPLYGLISDAVYISGQHRLPYLALAALLQAVSWLAIATLSESGISIYTMTIYLMFSNLGAAIAEVANDAIVAEASVKNPQSSSSGELQSFVWMASSVGGILGFLLGGIALEIYAPKKMFLFYGFLLALQFFVSILVKESSMNLPQRRLDVGIRDKLSELSIVLRKPEISHSIAWFAASYAIIPSLTGTMFFYQTQYLTIDSSVLGISKVFGQAAMFLWSIVYNRHLKLMTSRKLISAIQVTMAVFMISDALFAQGFYQSIGVSDNLYVVIFSGVSEVLLFIKILPFSILVAKLCPPGCEGSLMAFVMSAIAVAFIISGYLGIALASYVGVTGNDFSRLPLALLIQAFLTLLPLYWSPCIPIIEFDPKPVSKRE